LEQGTEGDKADNDRCPQQQGKALQLGTTHFIEAALGPEHDEWSDEQLAAHVSEPPRKPNAGECRGVGETASTKPPTPMVALIIVPGRRVRQANKTTWDESSNRSVDVLNRFSSAAVISASSVLPPAIREDVNSEPKVVTLARNAPAAIAGHSPFPHNRRVASASPLGGHTGSRSDEAMPVPASISQL
jgi:hypothetical protein